MSDLEDCARDRSRVARGIVAEKLFHGVADYGSKLSHDCALRPERDIFLRQEQAKKARSTI